MEIRSLWHEFASNLGFTVGDGRKIAFWEDNWIGHAPLKDSLTDLYRLTLLPGSSLATNREQEGWNFDFRRLLNDWEMGRFSEFLGILEPFQRLNNKHDKIFGRMIVRAAS